MVDADTSQNNPASSSNEVPIIDPHGAYGTIDPARIPEAIKHGAKIPTPEQIKENETRIAYENSPLTAGALGAANAVTFGGASQALTHTGLMSPEAQGAYEKYNAVPYGAGEFLGIGGSLLVGPEAAALKGATEALNLAKVAGDAAKIAEATKAVKAAKATYTAADLANPVSTVAKTGQKVSNAIESALPESTGIAGRILGATAAGGIGAATEGALYGVGQSVHENALGDPTLNGQKILSNIGYGALYGGALGGLIHGGEVAVPEAIAAAKSAGTKLYDYAIGLPGSEPGFIAKPLMQGASAVSGKPYEEIASVFKNRDLSLVPPEVQDKAVKEFADIIQEQHDAVNDVSKAVSRDIRPQEIENHLAEYPATSTLPQVQAVNDTFQKAISEMESRPAIYPANAPAKLRGLRDDFSHQIEDAETAADHYKAINELKQEIGKKTKAFARSSSPADQDANEVIQGVYKDLQKGLENEDFWGPIAARQSGLNDAISERIDSSKAFVKNFMDTTKQGGRTIETVNSGKVRTFLNKMNKPEGSTRNAVLQRQFEANNAFLEQAEKTYQSVPSKTFDKNAVKSVVDKAQEFQNNVQKQTAFNQAIGRLGGGAHNVQFGEMGAGAVALHNPLLGAGLEAFAMAKAPGLAIQRLAKIEKAIQKTTDSIEKYSKLAVKGLLKVGEPLTGYVGGKTGADQVNEHQKRIDAIGTYSSNPQLLIDKLQKATASVHTVAPNIAGSIQQTGAMATKFLSDRMPQQDMSSPLSKPLPPSPGEMEQFNRYYRAIENPINVLKEVAANNVSPETMDALTNVYPQLLQEMRTKTLENITNEMKKKDFSMPYQRKLALSMFMGQDLDSSLSQQNIAMNQNITQMTNQKNDAEQAQMSQPVKTSQSGLKNLKTSDRMLTSAQKSSQRKES